MAAVEIKDGIYWVGAVDWSVRDFHGYETPRGTSYNNYLIIDDQITLVDTVKNTFADETIRNIEGVIKDLSKIKNIVINHIENDHASSIENILRYTPDAQIYITEKGKRGFERFYDTTGWNFNIVKSGDTLNTGHKTLMFLETPMLHWPDSMMTYVKEDKLLISQDGFGQHIASSARFDDQYMSDVCEAELVDAVIDYYANILMPFGQIVKTKIAEIVKLGLEIDMIAPDHGVIWRRNADRVIQMYLDMANGKANMDVAIVYDTMWKSTEMMITPIVQGIIDEGIGCKVYKLRATPSSQVIKELWKSRGWLFGTPTLNNLMFPTVAGFMSSLRGLRPKNRIVGAFGSYGWGAGGVKGLYEEFGKLGLEIFEPGVEV
ncbi:MAG: FprA family A-type flavoprotein, partial [Rubrobacteridae bacterium]|nr:FprA family A-type flavoprotein [Rubrobacteridae bacterium]